MIDVGALIASLNVEFFFLFFAFHAWQTFNLLWNSSRQPSSSSMSHDVLIVSRSSAYFHLDRSCFFTVFTPFVKLPLFSSVGLVGDLELGLRPPPPPFSALRAPPRLTSSSTADPLSAASLKASSWSLLSCSICCCNMAYLAFASSSCFCSASAWFLSRSSLSSLLSSSSSFFL